MLKQAENYKELGNQFFKDGKYEESIREYTLAIELEPKNPVYYSNRSMAYLKLDDFQNSLNDAIFALQKLQLENDDTLKSKLEYRRDQAWNKLQNGITKIDSNSSTIGLSIREVDEIPKQFFTKVPSPELEPQANLSSISNDINHKPFNKIELPEMPTIPFLSTLHSKSPSSIYFNYVLQLDIQFYKDLFKFSGVDEKFLKFYLEACIWDLNKDSPDHSNTMFQSIETFTKLPRFSLTSMFIPSSLVKELDSLFKSKLDKDLNEVWV